MRLLNLLFQSAKRWRLGLGLGKRSVGHGIEPRNVELVQTKNELVAQRATCEALRRDCNEWRVAATKLATEVGEMKAERDSLLIRLELEQREHHKQKNATSQMWKFIHTRHRLNVPALDGTIRQTLMRAENRK